MNNTEALTLKCLSDLGYILKNVTRTQSLVASLLGQSPDSGAARQELLTETEKAEIQVELLLRKVEKLRARI